MPDPSRPAEAADPARDGDVAETDPSLRERDDPENDSSATETDDAESGPSTSETGDVDTDDTDPDDADATETDAGDDTAAAGSGPRGREVIVPTRVYKRVTVFSTLFAVCTVVGGFVLMDEATDRATAPLSEVDPLLALLGLGLIVLGAVTYAFSTRFRAEGMENAKDASDEPSDDG